MSNVSIIMGEFHKEYVSIMLDEANKAAKECGLTVVNEVWVPGSFEKPLALKRELMKKSVDCAVLLGIIERGETKHGLVMGQCVSEYSIALQLEYMKPVGMGILGPEIFPDQIEERLRPYAAGAVSAAKKMLT